MPVTLLIVAVALLFHVEASAQTVQQSNLNRLLDSELSRLAGPAGTIKAAIYVKHLGSGEEAGVRSNQHVDGFSAIRLAVMALAYRLVDQNQLNLSERYELKTPDLRGGSGILRYKDPGLKPTIRDVITQMIVTNDNTAADIMIAKVGGKDKVNAFLRESGFEALHLNHTTNEYFRQRYELIDLKYKALTPEEVFALSSDLPTITQPRRDMIKRITEEAAAHRVDEQMMVKFDSTEDHWLGIVTPAEIGRLLEGIERGTIASKKSCDEMKRIMRGQQYVGMINAPSGTIIISFYTIGYTGLTGPETDDRLGNVARLIRGYFDGTN